MTLKNVLNEGALGWKKLSKKREAAQQLDRLLPGGTSSGDDGEGLAKAFTPSPYHLLRSAHYMGHRPNEENEKCWRESKKTAT